MQYEYVLFDGVDFFSFVCERVGELKEAALG